MRQAVQPLGFVLALGGLAACASAQPKQLTPPAPTPNSTAPTAAAVPEPGPAPPVPAPESMETVVSLDFLATATAVAPGSTIWIAAHLKLAPGFRIFWVNPGDVGRPTRVTFNVPAGFELSETQYPPPAKFELPDGGLSYGYVEQTAAFAQLRIPADLEPQQLYRFEVEASWLACNESCYPESTTAFIEFGVSDSAAAAEFPAPVARLWQALPRPLNELVGVSYQWRRGGRLLVSAAETQWLDFLPAQPNGPKLVEIETNAKKSELELRFEDGTPGSRVKGLALAGNADGGAVKYVAVDIPWPVEGQAPAPKH